jgi:predicted RNA binding protein YcfA (HicA-like mRNA interferase family)
MPYFGPISRLDLISGLRRAGFSGPYGGKKHQFMEKDGSRLRIPNPHQSDIGVNLLTRILKQAGISKEEWERL